MLIHVVGCIKQKSIVPLFVFAFLLDFVLCLHLAVFLFPPTLLSYLLSPIFLVEPLHPSF